MDDVRAELVEQVSDLPGGCGQRELPVARQPHRPDGVHRHHRAAAGLVVGTGRRDHDGFVPAEGEVVGGPQHRGDDAVDRWGEGLRDQGHAHGAQHSGPG